MMTRRPRLWGLALLLAGCTGIPVAPPAPAPASFATRVAVTAPSVTYPYTSGVLSFTQAGTIRWYSDTSNGAYTPGDGNTVSMTFNGVGVHLYGSLQARGCPTVAYSLSGPTPTAGTFSCYNGGTTTPVYNASLLDVTGLEPGTYTLTLTNPTRGKYLYLYAVTVDLPPTVDAAANVASGGAYAGPPVWGP